MTFETIPDDIEKDYSHSLADIKYFAEHAHMPISRENLEALCDGDKLLESLYKEMLDNCIRYGDDVLKMEEHRKVPVELRDENWKTENERMEDMRTSLHERTIDSINILSRNLAEKGKNIEWMRAIVANERAGYTSFALALAFKDYLSRPQKETEN